MTTLALLATALLFGGATLFSFGLAPLVFAALPPDLARSTIRLRSRRSTYSSSSLPPRRRR